MLDLAGKSWQVQTLELILARASLIMEQVFFYFESKNQFKLDWSKSCNNEPTRVALQELTKIALPNNVRVGQNFQMGPLL